MKKEDVGPLIRTAVEAGLTATGHPLSAKIAGPLLTSFMDKAAERFGEANRRKVENWLHEIAASNEYASAEATIGLITEHIDEPWAHGPLEDAIRAIRDGIDEAALVYLAKLAAWQIRDKVPPDRWSRRAARLLLDCDSAMIDALVHLTSHLWSRWPDEIGALVRLSLPERSSLSFETVEISAHGIATSTRHLVEKWTPHPLYAEAFALLRVHQFAVDEAGGSTIEGKMLMHRPEAVYLVRVFLGSAVAAKIPGGMRETSP